MTLENPPPPSAGRLFLLQELRVAGLGEQRAFEQIVRLAVSQLECAFGWLGVADGSQLKLLGAQTGHLPPPTSIDLARLPGSAELLTTGHFDQGDLRRHPELASHPWVTAAPPWARTGAPPLRAMVGVAIELEGEPIGMLNLFDTRPRSWTESQHQSLSDLGSLASELMAARLKERRAKLLAARVRTASQLSNDWLWETDADGRITWLSDSIHSHTGRPAAEHLGQPLPALQQVGSQRVPFRDVQIIQETPQGPVSVRFSGVPVFNARGDFRGYRGAASNVTAELQAQALARQTEQMLSDALESMAAGLMITDAQGMVLRSNAVWRKRKAGTLPARPGGHWPSVLKRMIADGEYPDAIGHEEAFLRWRLGLSEAEGAQHELRWRDRWMMVSLRRLTNGQVVHLSIDVTELKQTQQRLARQQAELAESREQLSAVLQAVPDLWFVLDAQGRCLARSSEHHPLLERGEDRIWGQVPASDESVPADAAALAAVQAALSTGRLQRHEYALPAAPGSEARTVEARISPMSGQRVLYLLRDITEVRTLERDLMVLKRAVEDDAALPLCFADATQPDLPIVYVNRAFELQTGYSRQELLGRNCRLLQGPLTDQPAVASLREAIAQKRECSVVLDNVRKDGSVFSNALHIAPVYDADGRVSHYIGVIHDVTEQSRAAEQLRLSEALYRSVALAISDGLLVISASSIVIAANPAACITLGVAQQDLLGTEGPWPFEFLDDEMQPLPEAASPVKQVMQSGRALVNQVLSLQRPDGSLRWIELHAQPLELRPSSAAFSVVLTFRDITQQRLAEQALATAEERWKFALEGSGDGVWDWNAQTDRVFYSPRWKQMLGYAEHEIGDSIDEWTSRIAPEYRQRMMSELRQHLQGDTSVYQSEHPMRHRDGRELWVLDRGKVVGRDAQGLPLRVVGTQSDITSAKQAEQALREKQAAELANQAKTEFLSRMSHEMRTPLNAVIGFAQLMRLEARSGDDTDPQRGYAEHVLSAGQHLLALINDVLDLQQVEQGKLPLDMQTVDLSETVQRTIELLTHSAAARRISFDNRLRSSLWVTADAQRLRQVVINIASNAVKYNREQGEVGFRAESLPERRLRLSISDNGPGMTSQQMSRLFQPFERLGRETSTIEGTGLGLIIARSLVQVIGGSLEVHSRPGHGTRVDIELMAADAPDTVTTATPSPSLSEPAHDVSPASAPLRLLYVEDNRINAILFEGALRMHNSGVELRVAEDGEEALAIVENWIPEVLVLDAHLPGMSGFDVLRLLRARPGLSSTPAYMCSADAMPEDVQRAYEAGFIGYWTKPIDIATVLSDITALGLRLRSQNPV